MSPTRSALAIYLSFALFSLQTALAGVDPIDSATAHTDLSQSEGFVLVDLYGDW